MKKLITITELSAIKASLWKGLGDKYSADKVATEVMRKILNQSDIDGKIVIGEGEMDQAPMLYIGEKVGLGKIEVDIAVDPLDGTNLTAFGKNNAITVIAFSPKDSLLYAPDMYMKKIAVGKHSKGKISLQASLTDNLKSIAQSLNKTPSQITVALLERERHKDFVEEIHRFGARVMLLEDGDVLPCIQSALDQSVVDMYYGIGGAPEGVLAAVGVKILGGDFQGQLVVEDQDQEKRCIEMGINRPKERVFLLEDLVKKNNNIMFMSAVTSCFFGEGVVEKGDYYQVNSLILEEGLNPIQTVQSLYSKESFITKHN